MSDKVVKICDFCNKEISEPGPGHGFVLTIGDYQKFTSVNENAKDACSMCCQVIARAISWLGLEFNESSLWEQAGYIKREKTWVDQSGNEPGFVTMHGWRNG